MILVKGDVPIQIANDVIGQILYPFIARIKCNHLAAKCGLGVRASAPSRSMDMLKITGYDFSRIVRRSIVHNDPLQRKHRLNDHPFKGLFDVHRFITRRSNQDIGQLATNRPVDD